MNSRTPTPPERIQWHEGMLLGPQHFQQLQARIDGLASWHLLAAAPLAWGLRHLEIDTGLLATGVLRVLRLEAVMPDGSAVWHDAREAAHGSLEIDLGPQRDALEAGALDIHLTLPWARSMRNPSVPSRFRAIAELPVEDEVSDGEPADLPRLRPQLGLAAGGLPPSLWQSMRLCTVVKDNELIRLGDELPALQALDREHPLWRRAWALCGQLRGKAAYLARQTQLPSSRLEDRLALLEQRERLGALLAPLAPLEALLQAQAPAPLTLYLALCAALGPLATLRAGAMPLLPPAYEHARPRAAFEAVFAALEDALQAVSQEHRLQPFDFREGLFVLALQPEWIGARLVVGLRGQSERELTAWMDGAVIGSASAWTSLRERRVLGAARSRIEAAPELGLQASNGYTLFAIEASAPLVQPGEPLLIANANESHAAQRPHEAMLFVKG
ncbi:type VI secretion system protein ImpJ [Sphaerotilus hippei]|uniref:Type VI secretion system protein ImpJ n=1 Tax=Sphaerotilus hippei TaxID=744406 RepID=A0A318HDE0_9BURK|nr:type VI secretion system baseplate subunit TssK [Sphaerotilus hippei]PXW97486.1 type VI secretion system protein ImpJ [Sphaerotilus hippei]